MLAVAHCPMGGDVRWQLGASVCSSSGGPSSGQKGDFALGRESGAPIGGPELKPAQMHPAQESNVQGFLRAGTLLIVVFQGLFFAMHARLLGASFTRHLFVLHLIGVGCGCAGFLATYSSLVRRHWRPIAFCVSSAVVIGASLVTTSAAHEREIGRASCRERVWIPV